MLVKHIGSRAVQADTMYGSGRTWDGFGDVQEVENEQIARRMCECSPMVFELVDPLSKLPQPIPIGLDASQAENIDETTVALPDGRRVRLVDAPRKQLAAYARDEVGLNVLDGHTRADILTAVANVEEARARTAQRATGTDPAKGNGASPQPPGAAPAGSTDAAGPATKSAQEGEGNEVAGTAEADPAPVGLAAARPPLDPLAGFDTQIGD